jgi:hypothetical protein
VPESLLQILTFFLLLLVWLFLMRVIWAVWSDARTPTVVAAGPAGAAPAAGAGPAAAPAPAAATPQATTLKVIEPSERKGQIYDVGDEVKIGRAATCQVALADDSYVSQLHARLFRRDGSIFLEDLGSTNGTFLNRKKVASPVALRRGDRIQIGRTVLEVAK